MLFSIHSDFFEGYVVTAVSRCFLSTPVGKLDGFPSSYQALARPYCIVFILVDAQGIASLPYQSPWLSLSIRFY
jgi:hypothetical protein